MKRVSVYVYLLEEARKATSLDEIITARKILNFALQFCPDLKVSEARDIHEILLATENACFDDMQKEGLLYETI